MVNYRLHPRLKSLLGGLLLAGSCGLGMEARGRAAQLVGETLKNRAKSAAEAASSAAQSSSQPGDAKQIAKRGQAPLLPAPGKSPTIVGQRDPFRLPPPPGPGGEVSGEEFRGPAPPGSGPRSLVIGQLRLEGIVRLDQSNTMIAVVTNYTNRAYFLRENDPVYNGVVSKITPDSITFRENYLDQLGRAQVREISRRLSGALGEGR